MCSDVLRCSQMFSDNHRCFWIFSRYSIDVLLMFSRCSQDICRIFPGCFHDALMGLVGLVDFDDHFNERMDFNGPKEFDDPQLFDDQLKVWTLIIEKSTVIPPSLMVLFFKEMGYQLICAKARNVFPLLSPGRLIKPSMPYRCVKCIPEK